MLLQLIRPRGAQSYLDKVLSIETASLIAYWPLNETSGATADNAEGTAARDGSYTGVTLGQSQAPFVCPLFDGANDVVNIYSASLNSAFDPALGSLSFWLKVSGAGVWTDSTSRYLISLRADGNNRIQIYRSSGHNRIDMIYEADNVIETISITGLSTTGWIHMGCTWNASGNFTAYVDGVATGTPQAIGGTWAGNLNTATTTTGAASTTPAAVFDGYIAHVPVWTAELSAAQMAQLAET